MSVLRRGECLDVVHVVSVAGKRPEIRRCDSFRIETDELGALKRLGQAPGLKQQRCATLLGEAGYRLVQLEAPAVPREERVQALRWRLKDMVDFPVDGAAVAVIDIPTEGSRQAHVFAVISPSTVIDERMTVYRNAKLPLEVIDIPEMAVRNVAALFEDENRGLAFLALIEGESLLTITCRGELYLARRIDVSSTALADADIEKRRQLLERLALELQRTLDNFDRQFGFVSVSKLVVACEHDAEAVVAALAENLYLPVKGMDLAEVADFPMLPELRSPARQAQCLAAIGTALRSAP